MSNSNNSKGIYIQVENEKKKKIDFTGFYQCFLIYNTTIKVGFHKESIPYPFYCETVFTKEDEATLFMRTFIEQLIKKGDIPKDVIKDHVVDEERIRVGIKHLNLATVIVDNDHNLNEADKGYKNG